MRPKQGDSVRFTDRFVNNTSIIWVPALSGEELSVVNLKLKTMVPVKIFTVYIMVNNMMYKVDVNDTGHYVDPYNTISNDMVFELYQDLSQNPTASASRPTQAQAPAWAPTTAPVERKPISADETNSVCSKCGAPALDMGFKVLCTNTGCENYDG